jgi:hypothetical protein
LAFASEACKRNSFKNLIYISKNHVSTYDKSLAKFDWSCFLALSLGPFLFPEMLLSIDTPEVEIEFIQKIPKAIALSENIQSLIGRSSLNN